MARIARILRCLKTFEDVYVELQDISDHAVLARGHTDANGKVTLEYFKEGQCTPALDLGMRDTTGKFFGVLNKFINFGDSWSLADEPERTHSTKDGPAVAPFEPEDSYCPVGQTCDVACARGFAGFDAAKGCKNANVGYCCK